MFPPIFQLLARILIGHTMLRSCVLVWLTVLLCHATELNRSKRELEFLDMAINVKKIGMYALWPKIQKYLL